MKRPGPLEAAVGASAAAMLFITFFSQHPNRIFDRLRTTDKLGFWLPNWRFFAPEPAQSDFHVLHRTLSSDGTESEWEETHQTTPRKLSHFIWFPDRRTDKGIFDAIADLMAAVPQGEDQVLRSPAYRTIAAFVRRRINDSAAQPIDGYQFMLATSTGFDESNEPEELLTSPYIPLRKA